VRIRKGQDDYTIENKVICRLDSLVGIEQPVCTKMASFLQTLPRGAYTCARADASGAISEHDFHVQRLVDSFDLVFCNDMDDETKHIQLLGEVRGMAKQQLAVSISQDSMLVILIYLEDGTPNVHNKVVPLTSMRRSVLDKVLVGGGSGRRNPNAKHSMWIDERKSLEALRNHHEACELVLVETDELGDMRLLEGLVTNFYVILRDGVTIMTAPPTQILAGSVRQSVCKAAAHGDFHIVERCPRWSEKDQWLAAFITSVAKPGCFIKQLIGVDQQGNVTSKVSLVIEHPRLAEFCLSLDKVLEI
jgi:branched-subunit amino acid aminotransferase/4-amino-4-deoxychorismate lyase